MNDELKAKILEYLKNPVRGATLAHLMAEFNLGTTTSPSYVAASRPLDRALQALRKEGRIRFTNRQWQLV